MALYGPNADLAGAQGGEGDLPPRAARDQTGRAAAAGAADPHLAPPDTSARVRLQRDAKFPLRYRHLVGEYFRAIAESLAK
jgi:hypothetical protein